MEVGDVIRHRGADVSAFDLRVLEVSPTCVGENHPSYRVEGLSFEVEEDWVCSRDFVKVEG